MKNSDLERLNQTLRATKRINKAILHIRQNPRRLLQEVCNILVQERNYESVWIGELRNGELYPAIASTVVATPQDQLETRISQAPYNQTVAEQALREGRTVLGQKTQSLPPNGLTCTWTTVAVPMLVNGVLRAILTACATETSAFDQAEMQLLEEISADIGFALESMEAEARRGLAEEALRTSEERFRRLAENSLIGIVIIQNDLFRYANPALAQMYGYADPDELIDQRGPLDLTAPESRSLIEEYINKCLRNEVQTVRHSFKGVRKDGSLFDVEVYGSRAMHARRPAVIASVMDITARERSRRQLEALTEAGLALSRTRTPQEALHRAVEKAAQVVPGDAANIVLLNGQRLELVAAAGYHRLNVNVRALIDSGVHIESLPTYQTMLATRAPILIADTANSDLWTGTNEAMNIRAYLGVPLIARGEIIGFLNVDGRRAGQFSEADTRHLQLFADYVAATIEHLRLVDSLEKERQRLTILNALSQTLSETLELKEVARRALAHIGSALNIEHGMIHLWDKSAHTLTSISEQGIAQPVRTIYGLAEKNAEQTLLHWVASQREAESESTLDLPLKIHDELIGIISLVSANDAIHKEDDQQLLKTLSVPIALALQNARFYEAAAHQAKVMEEALRRQEELDRMKDEMLQNVSHELRTPLALVTGYTQLLQDGSLGPIPEQQAEAIEIIARRSAMLRSLVENITLLWQMENPKEEFALAEPVDLCQLIQTIRDEFQNEMQQRSLTLITEIPAHPLMTIGVYLQFYRLLDNLIGNALKFTPPGGKIKITLQQDGQYALLAVCDTGIGVPQEKLEQIFERFYQIDGSTKRRYGGVGLGLALVKSIVEAHGGNVYAESPCTDDPANPGLCVNIRLPLSSISRTERR
ncbi:MAG TPA: GAF domain-containing protein [Anaerolineae bacterium]|nr:GAF domain-containing protein [Anaerolineae bacterium]HQI83724.1 GAF domain-containing protein [Anaerolineae bacterium]